MERNATEEVRKILVAFWGGVCNDYKQQVVMRMADDKELEKHLDWYIKLLRQLKKELKEKNHGTV